MTAQTLYNQLVQGTISKNKFLYEVRKQSHLPIAKFNSFEDTVQILKTRGLISEEIGKYKTDKNVFFPKQEIKTIDQVSPHEYAKGINFELDLFDKSVGQNMPTDEELAKVQEKVLQNLSSDEYYYTRKMMSKEQKDIEKEDLEIEELGKDMTAKNQLEKGKTLKENLDQHYSQDDEDLEMNLSQPEDCESCERDGELDMDVMDPSELERLSKIIEEWGLTEFDLEDSDVIEELTIEFQRREGDIDEAIAVKDKAGNIQYAKDDSEATDLVNTARTKGVQLVKQNV